MKKQLELACASVAEVMLQFRACSGRVSRSDGWGGGEPASKFTEIRRYFSKIAGNSADFAVNLLRTADAPLS